MKQQINSQDLAPLSESAYDKLMDWWKDHRSLGQDLPYLSIGQMIEFLEDAEGCNEINISNDGGRYSENHEKWTVYNCSGDTNKGELCDALWEAVKEIL